MFRDFSKRAFSLRWGANIPVLGRLVQLKYHSQYETMGLEDALKEAFGEELLFGGRRHFQSPSRCKVAVTTTDTNKEARLLTNYNRATKIKTPYQFQRFEKPDQEMFTWEAARATSAAPGFFRSFYHTRNSHTYQDGALKLNNPVLAADYERQCVWEEGPQSLPDVLVSIGTGFFPDVKVNSGDPGPRTGIGLVNGAMTFVNIAKDAIETELDCEKTWEDYVQCAVPEGNDRRNRYHRLTLEIHGPKIELDAVNEMSRLQDLTRAYYKENTYLIDNVAGQLIASLFYFNVVSRVSMTVTGNHSTCFYCRKTLTTDRSGMIKCRLPPDIAPKGSLKKIARTLLEMRFNSSFLFTTAFLALDPNVFPARQFRIYPSINSNRWVPAPIDDAMLYSVEQRQNNFQVQVTFDLNDPSVSSAIYLDIPSFSPQMISGFPRRIFGQDLATCERNLSPTYFYHLPTNMSLVLKASPNLSRYNSSISVPQEPFPKPKSPF